MSGIDNFLKNAPVELTKHIFSFAPPESPTAVMIKPLKFMKIPNDKRFVYVDQDGLRVGINVYNRKPDKYFKKTRRYINTAYGGVKYNFDIDSDYDSDEEE
tara:strand:+ start:2636 stop:2938 length:303 start_codon:yes stop_codon:yes gene_type:complete